MNNPDNHHEVCPYDVSHVIIRSRMLVHLAKCSKNFPLAEKRPCPFNNKHVIPEPELQYHMRNCPDSGKLTNYIHRVGDVTCPVKDYLPINIEMPNSSEDWDNDVQSASVLSVIKESATEKDIILTNALIGQSKSKRKGFRMDEVKRHNHLKEQKKHATEKPVKTSPDDNTENTDPEEMPIRRPTEMSSKTGAIKKRYPRAVETTHGADGGGIITGETSSPGSIRSSINANSGSYASYLAAKKQNEESQGCGPSEIAGTNHEARGRGRVSPSPERIPVPNNRVRLESIANTCLSETSSEASSQVDRFPTDKRGFLTTPVPGKGRGRPIL